MIAQPSNQQLSIQVLKKDNTDPYWQQNCPSCHIVPVRIKQNFDNTQAQVQNYFIPTIKDYNKQSNLFQASILGHQLIGKQEKVNDIYTCTLIRSKNKINLTMHQKLNQVTCWKKDKPWNQNDGPLKTIEKCIAIQAALHDY